MARGLIRGRTRLVAIAASVGLGLAGLAACGSGGGIKNADTGSSNGKSCGDLRIAVNPWTGYVANAHVIGYLAKTKLGGLIETFDLDRYNANATIAENLVFGAMRNGRQPADFLLDDPYARSVLQAEALEEPLAEIGGRIAATGPSW